MLAETLARLAVRRPAVLVAAAIFLFVAAAGVIQVRQSFDSEILNLLPAENAAVKGLKLYNANFNSARELAFLVEGEGADDFVSALAVQPWVLRVFDGLPMESEVGRETLPDLAAPLLLGQAAEDFEATTSRLNPEALRAHLKTLVARAMEGSPLARIEMQNDPLGLIGPVAGELAERLSISETFQLTTQDGGTRIVPVVPRVPSGGAEECRELMAQVHAFLADWAAKPGAPRVSVTGRAAYVDEISSSMQRDIGLTSLVSIAAVTILFWFSFRSLLPLAGSVLILAWTCVVSLGGGMLVFDKLNVVAMGFCSILIGLGDDFSLLLYQRYTAARGLGLSREAAIADSTRHGAPGILWVALTTGLGFAALSLSGSAGFGQLGILIALGVLCSAVGMIVLMPLFERKVAMRSGDPVLGFCQRFLSWAWVPRAGIVVFLGSVIVAVSPWRTLHFDTSTHSLEPRDIPAAKCLARMMELFPGAFEPVMIVVPRPEGGGVLAELDARLAQMKASGVVRSFSSPAALVADAGRVHANRSMLESQDWEGLERVVDSVEQESGLKAGSLEPARHLLRNLQNPRSLVESLPPPSPWWFLLDRMISPGSGDVIYYVGLPQDANEEARRGFEQAIGEVHPAALVTGWSQMLHDLVPWARRELVVFGSAVLAIIALVLAFTYRSIGTLLLHLLTLALAMCGTIATLKLTGRPINLLNVLAFPLILAVGVDYGVHLILAAREKGALAVNLPLVMKPVLISALTTMTGFGALTLARNPALSGLGFVCATGVWWCLISSFLILVPLALRGWLGRGR